MEKLNRAKKIKNLALILAAALSAASLVGVALLSLNLLYVPLVVCIVIAIASIYAIPFLWISIKDDKLYAKIMSKIEDGTVSVDELSASLGIKPVALRKIINKGVKKEYVSADKITA